MSSRGFTDNMNWYERLTYKVITLLSGRKTQVEIDLDRDTPFAMRVPRWLLGIAVFVALDLLTAAAAFGIIIFAVLPIAWLLIPIPYPLGPLLGAGGIAGIVGVLLAYLAALKYLWKKWKNTA